MSTLARLFNPDRLQSLDPNKPENKPLFDAETELRNQAFVRWYEEVGHYLVDGLEKALIGKIVSAIGHNRSTIEDCIANLRLLDEIKKDVSFVDHIVKAFKDEEERRNRG